MSIPDAYIRGCVPDAMAALARRFGLTLPADDDWQDWQWWGILDQVDKLPSLLDALEASLPDDNEADHAGNDQRFALAEMVMSCFAELTCDDDLGLPSPRKVPAVAASAEWQRFVACLRSRPTLHASTLDYWSRGVSTFGIEPLVLPLWAEVEPLLARAT